jgi:hypothetical protein
MDLKVVDIAALMGTMAALIAIAVALWQLRDSHVSATKQLEASNKYAIAQNWLAVRAILSNYDDIHVNLRPRGDWHQSLAKPDTVKDWARTELYMGTLEFVEDLMSKDLLEHQQIADWYRYRVRNILCNPRIVKFKLIENAKDWARFHRLRDRLGLSMPEEKEGLLPFIASRDATG